MAVEQPPLSKRERIQQAEGRIGTSELLIRKWWARMRTGDQTPSRAELRQWIREEAVTLRKWRKELDDANKEALPSVA